MASYVRDPLEELWKEILQIQWRYLETEESMKKIEERKVLEGRLKEYISVVPHDRKFFLSETEHILRKSITQMKDFSAFKGADGFESISHYANNLFTKPWRKEYRVIKVNVVFSSSRIDPLLSVFLFCFRCTRDFISMKSRTTSLTPSVYS
jgi:hypothetical protein